MSEPEISFYIPPTLWSDSFPTCPNTNWSGFGLGIYAWTVQTYLYLRELGVPCQLVNQVPETGLVLLHRNALRGKTGDFNPSARRLLVCFQGDLPPTAQAQVHIVQNPAAADEAQGYYFMPHWPQPGLLPRESTRGDRFATVAFLGHQSNLAAELCQPTWIETLEHLGLTWHAVINTNRWNDHQILTTAWNDYRQVDVIVAVRSFDRREWQKTAGYRYKPATKLYNAWLAGVPAILGIESAYQAERRSAWDYVEVGSLADLVSALMRLKADWDWRQRLVAQGQQRALEVAPLVLAQHWRNLLETTLIPLYDGWCSQSTGQRLWRVQHQRLAWAGHQFDQGWRHWRYG